MKAYEYLGSDSRVYHTVARTENYGFGNRGGTCQNRLTGYGQHLITYQRRLIRYHAFSSSFCSKTIHNSFEVCYYLLVFFLKNTFSLICFILFSLSPVIFDPRHARDEVYLLDHQGGWVLFSP